MNKKTSQELLPGIPKKLGRPPSGQAKTPTQRKREQLASDIETVAQVVPRFWPERICLMVLKSSTRYPKTSQTCRDAWRRLGKLRGFL